MENESPIAKSRNQVPRLDLNQDTRKAVHSEPPMVRFNSRLAVLITRSVGSMWCAYLFTLIALISLPAALNSHDPIIIVSWIAQTFLQLVLLPIIIVGQNVQAAASDARALSDHQTLIAIHTLTSEVHDIAQKQTAMLTFLEDRANNGGGKPALKGE